MTTGAPRTVAKRASRPAARLPTAASTVRVRAARVADLPMLEAFIAAYTGDGTLLPRTRTNLLSHLRDFRLAWRGTQLIGCGALQLVDRNLAEIRSVAVDPEWRGFGVGHRIVETLLRDARRLGLARVFCLTRRLDFFARHGFLVVPTEEFPHKVWNDCRFCPRQSCCDETAMQRVLVTARAPRARRIRAEPLITGGAQLSH